MDGIANEGDSNTPGTLTTQGRQLDIVQLLGVGREKGKPPADLYASYNLVGAEDITIDTFRTTIWRMKDKVFETAGAVYVVHGDGGVYWKEVLEPPEPEYERDEHLAEADYVPDWARDDGEPLF